MRHSVLFQRDIKSPIFLVLVSGWSDNGWLSGGHAVRMAMELCTSLIVNYYCYLVYSAYLISQLCTRLGHACSDV